MCGGLVQLVSHAVDVLPSPFDPSPPDDQLSHYLSTHENTETEIDYDWATFINAYALGRWDPLRTPNPPRSHLQAPSHPRASRPDSRISLLDDVSEAIYDSPQVDSLHNLQLPEWAARPSHDASQMITRSSQLGSTVPDLATSSTSTPFAPQSASSATEVLDRRFSVPISHGLRTSFPNLYPDSYSVSPFGQADRHQHPHIPTTEATTTAAAIRWAAARVSVAPLALPSPEHELTDPMRGMTATIPGSHPQDVFQHPQSPLISPGIGRKTRLSSFWEGTQDIEENQRLPTIEASSSEGGSEKESEKEVEKQKRKTASSLPLAGPLPPATAPVRYSEAALEEDYFGNIESSRLESLARAGDHHSSNISHSSTSYAAVRLEHPEPHRQISAPPLTLAEQELATVPALPRRICLTRQTSAPLPTGPLFERRLKSARPASENGLLGLAGRAAKEEQMFSELGYLAPPNPPDELERRRALYKFNIWNTGRDVNFDRIAHLVKLVFNTRIVAISLVDGTEEFFKAESGFGTQNMPRTTSFDAHTILQRDDEPTVVLDAQEDWRFVKNPLVTGHPHVRFYAACPLRTQDGFNIGALSIIDETPRREFSPRQRHTLKEFAQIAMRELELWRDKIQLRIRDRIQNSMEQFTRECLEVDKEADGDKALFVSTSMEQVYERAARLVKRTLDVEGAIVLDVSHIDVLETISSESCMSITLHDADRQAGTTSKLLSKEEYTRLQEFFVKNPDGKICEGIVPAVLRPFLPTRIQYALAVPIFNIDKRPFALLCAYSTGERTTPFLEGHELSYLRAIGVIILSAVLKRRMTLADKAKGLFISNISHELRTPLHGILASAELLSDTPLDHSQASFLQTVQACGTSLVETVNHVLDFTKLSGNAKSGGVENVIQLCKVDLMQLVEEATEGCWIGHRARMFTSEIGSVYSPPKQDRHAIVVPSATQHVETVIDIGHNRGSWAFLCEKGGIRRILMNVFGNSLKFTSDGYVHVILRQLPTTSDMPRNKIRIELSVTDTGKGISQSFLKNQLFHPFSQENPLQTGTGLGLAIVNSIVRSPGVDGKVDVWSAEGVGTEIKITFTAEAVEDEQASSCDDELVKVYDQLNRPSLSLLGFNNPHRGIQLLRTVVSSYLVSRWGFSIVDEPQQGQVVIVNEDVQPVAEVIESKQADKPFIILSSARGDPRLMAIVSDYERIGGFCRIVYKPVGPARLYSALKLCLHSLNIGQTSRTRSPSRYPPDSPAPGLATSPDPSEGGSVYCTLPRRFSEEKKAPQVRPPLGARAVTAHPLGSWSHMTSTTEQHETELPDRSASQSPTSTTISVGTGGTLLKLSVGTVEAHGPLRVLVIEDNSILRNLLTKWLKNKGYEFREAVDGQQGVQIFESDGFFDVVLVDLSMPVLDGVSATAQMRVIESARKSGQTPSEDPPIPMHSARILALTGMSSLEDKRRAFEAGVDGYLVKPVAFKTLDTMFQKLGIS
ncbi:hypothetical protein AcV7_006488 [Taiwanofungus camphoratus]|nr:hypothetical protein AcV7_006488 [Antrodia cinnamomea]